MVKEKSTQSIERNLAMELVRVTEAAALSAARYMGMGDKNLVDQAAVDTMRSALGRINMDGVGVHNRALRLRGLAYKPPSR